MNNLIRQVAVGCPICLCQRHRMLYTHQNFIVVTCCQCTFCYTFNPVHPDDIKYLYSGNYFSIEKKTVTNDVRGADDIAKRRNRIVAQKLYNILKTFGYSTQSPRLLEIGAGTGFFLNEAKNAGFSVEGVEISEEACAFIDNQFKIKVHCGEITDINFGENNNFDMIVMWHVLEHVPNLAATLKCIYNLLNTNGLLAIEVPNVRSLKWRLSKNKFQGGLHPKYHRYFFSHKSLKKLLVNHGFEFVYHGGQFREEFLPQLYNRNFKSVVISLIRYVLSPLMAFSKTEMIVRSIVKKRLT